MISDTLSGYGLNAVYIPFKYRLNLHAWNNLHPGQSLIFHILICNIALPLYIRIYNHQESNHFRYHSLTRPVYFAVTKN
ncbi:hypothetical protein VQ7734_00212 [Vibrio quintilis]|uniref:Uncharacterized protein n=1 Tax=Vibrio quintilis TaxID=1117707 RepID=A0A1M7YPD9_9VIBR|nr:hypothetical protein VQ7734_00212 [Vibrio quintilis]